MIATLTTPRLRLRPLAADDEALYLQLYGDPETMRHIVAAQSAEAARHSFAAALRANAAARPSRRSWVMQALDTGLGIGLIGIVHDDAGSGEVGAVLAPPHQGRGYATEAIAALAEHAFTALGLEVLHTRHAAGHGLAAGLMAGLGFERGADGAGRQPVRWRLPRERWQQRQ